MRLDVLAPLTKVRIPALNQNGLIESIKVDYGNTILYQVSYWWEGEQRFSMLHAFEIEKVT